jgi:hypothetical protein
MPGFGCGFQSRPAVARPGPDPARGGAARGLPEGTLCRDAIHTVVSTAALLVLVDTKTRSSGRRSLLAFPSTTDSDQHHESTYCSEGFFRRNGEPIAIGAATSSPARKQQNSRRSTIRNTKLTP